jgi:undecaprenyl-diphosphatase
VLQVPQLIVCTGVMPGGTFKVAKTMKLALPVKPPYFLPLSLLSFVVALVVIRAFVAYISRSGFAPFAWYRIAFGAVILVTAYAGLVRWD